MPVLPNEHWEKFAQGLVSGLSAHVAYLKAGYKGKVDDKNTRRDASRLRMNKEVRGRIAELQLEAARESKITVMDLVKELQAFARLSKQCKQPGAGVGAVMGIGKLLGFVIDKAEIDATLRKPARRATTDTKISLEEWKEKFAPKLEQSQ